MQTREVAPQARLSRLPRMERREDGREICEKTTLGGHSLRSRQEARNELRGPRSEAPPAGHEGDPRK
jgi:hypothetical protein